MKSPVVTVILVLAVVGFAGLSYYFYSRAIEAKSAATDYGTQLQECGAGLAMAKSGVSDCKEVLAGLAQVPACAVFIPQE